ncbi:MAG TPA: hypothetical protein VEJ19_03765 [Nitrososphaerales archaeon]|nr:hypothetical protein [Nitrososphaerales archaeon]
MRYEVTAGLLIVAIVAGAGVGYYVSSSDQSITTSVMTTTSFITRSGYTFTVTKTVTTTCSGYPPGGDCITPYSYTFALSVNYTGSWKVAYQGYNSLGRSNPTNVSGGYSGTGSNSTMITLIGLSNNGLTLCAQAQKLDSSNRTLTLTITGYNETSLPYGVVSYCGGVVP